MLAVSDGKLLAEMLVKERQDFEGAATVIAELTRNYPLGPTAKRELSTLHSYYEMRAAFDRFDYTEVIRLISGASPGDALPEGTEKTWLEKAKLLDRGSRILLAEVNCSKHEKSPMALLDDLMVNAQLCALRQRYDDAVSRLYRATELLAQVRLKQLYEINTSDVNIDSPFIPEQTRARLNEQKDEKKKITLALMESYRLLYEIGDPVGGYWHANLSQLPKYLDKRNQSYLAHGFQTITKEIWSDFGDGWIAWIERAKESSSIKQKV